MEPFAQTLQSARTVTQLIHALFLILTMSTMLMNTTLFQEKLICSKNSTKEGQLLAVLLQLKLYMIILEESLLMNHGQQALIMMYQ